MKAGSSQYSQFCSSKDMCLLFGDMIFIPNMNSNILKTPESLWKITSPYYLYYLTCLHCDVSWFFQKRSGELLWRTSGSKQRIIRTNWKYALTSLLINQWRFPSMRVKWISFVTNLRGAANKTQPVRWVFDLGNIAVLPEKDFYYTYITLEIGRHRVYNYIINALLIFFIYQKIA